MELEQEVRIAAFNWLTEQTRIFGEVLPRKLLEKGFDFKGTPISLVSPQGIFRPKILKFPLSITTAPKGPYDDAFDSKGLLTYRYRGQDPNHPDNVGLRNAIHNKLPLIYLHGIVPGKYLPVWPVYVVQDNVKDLCFTVAVDEMTSLEKVSCTADNVQVFSEARRAYITSEVRVRLHQNAFRERVLQAYKSQCAFCSLRHEELLDAAHIIPDNEPHGEPIIENGLALCKLHHAAFDCFFIGVTPDYSIQVRRDLLDEKDGPMLQFGIKGLHNNKLILPLDRKHFPKQEYLEWRFERFLKSV